MGGQSDAIPGVRRPPFPAQAHAHILAFLLFSCRPRRPMNAFMVRFCLPAAHSSSPEGGPLVNESLFCHPSFVFRFVRSEAICLVLCVCVWILIHSGLLSGTDARHRRPEFQKNEPGLKTGDLSKRLSAEWKALDSVSWLASALLFCLSSRVTPTNPGLSNTGQEVLLPRTGQNPQGSLPRALSQ